MNFCLSLMSLTATNGSLHIVNTPMQILVKLPFPPLFTCWALCIYYACVPDSSAGDITGSAGEPGPGSSHVVKKCSPVPSLSEALTLDVTHEQSNISTFPKLRCGPTAAPCVIVGFSIARAQRHVSYSTHICPDEWRDILEAPWGQRQSQHFTFRGGPLAFRRGSGSRFNRGRPQQRLLCSIQKFMCGENISRERQMLSH